MSGQHSEQSIERLLLCSRCASQLLDALRPVLQQVRDSELVSNVQAPRCQIAHGQAEYDFRRGRLGTSRVCSENRHEVVLLSIGRLFDEVHYNQTTTERASGSARLLPVAATVEGPAVAAARGEDGGPVLARADDPGRVGRRGGV